MVSRAVVEHPAPVALETPPRQDDGHLRLTVLGGLGDEGVSEHLRSRHQTALTLAAEERQRYDFPFIHVVKPGGPYFKWPWQRLYRIDMTIQTTDIVWDPDIQQSTIESVTKDNLTIALNGQIRWKPCERNLYGYLFGVARPRAHVMGYFISVLRDRIATFHSQGADAAVDGISINDLRKNLSVINQFMEASCKKTAARYGIELEAALIPVNRAAGRRALARLAREVKRVTLGVGRNAMPSSESAPVSRRASSPSHHPPHAETG